MAVLLMRCDACKNWTTARVMRYGDGSEIANWRAPEGKGECSVLSINTLAEFGCTSFAEIPVSAIPTIAVPHVVSNWKNGAPWQHWKDGPCPDCRGTGNTGGPFGGACNRCAGRSTVRYYEDGFIGTNQTLYHPKEKEQEAQVPLKCRHCDKPVNIEWLACPFCAMRLEEPVAETEYVGGLGNAGGEFKQNGKEHKTEALRRDIAAMNEHNEKIAAMRRMTTDRGCSEDEAAVAREMVDRLEAMNAP
jgi:hypothetical protein